jgi:hypothetical protein
MRRALPALALLLAGLVPAACSGPAAPTAAPGGVAGSSAGAPADSPSGSASPTGGGSAAASGGTAGAGCAQGARTGPVTLTERDNGSAVCLARGGSLEIYLHAKTGEEWSKPTPDRPVLQPVASGKGALQIGVTAGFFTAVSAGQTRVTAQLVPCKGPKPGPMCDVVEFFQVTVTVR